MIKPKIFVVGGGLNYINWIDCYYGKSIKDCDLVMFTGGEDVNPAIYNRRKHTRTNFSDQRDSFEIHMMAEAVEQKKPIIGICRGAQLVCALAGGILVQHQNQPGFIHPIHLPDGRILDMSSTHHQSQYPWVLPPEEYHILAVANNLSAYHEGDGIDMEQAEIEVEICYYPKILALGIQGHPELLNEHAYSETLVYCRDLVQRLLKGQL